MEESSTWKLSKWGVQLQNPSTYVIQSSQCANDLAVWFGLFGLAWLVWLVQISQASKSSKSNEFKQAELDWTCKCEQICVYQVQR